MWGLEFSVGRLGSFYLIVERCVVVFVCFLCVSFPFFDFPFFRGGGGVFRWLRLAGLFGGGSRFRTAPKALY